MRSRAWRTADRRIPNKRPESDKAAYSPFLFLLVVDLIMNTFTSEWMHGIHWIAWMQLDGLNFSDDLALPSYRQKCAGIYNQLSTKDAECPLAGYHQQQAAVEEH